MNVPVSVLKNVSVSQVTKRKVSGGSRSMEGFSNTASLLTVIQSCRSQGRSVLEFFRQALAFVEGDTTISLIPP